MIDTMTKRRVTQPIDKRLSDAEAMALHRKMMQDPEYAAKWNALMAALSGLLCELPADALDDVPRE